MPRRTARSLLAACGLLVALAFAPGAEAGGPHRGGHKGPSPGDLVARHAERLGLDEATLVAIGQIVAESGARDEQLRAEIDAGRDSMRALLSEEVPEETAVLANAEALGALETEIHKNRLRAIMRIRALLTPEQRAELMRIREEKHLHPRHGPLGHCSGDLRALCEGVEAGLPALSCLHTRWAELSEACHAAFDPEQATCENRAH